MKKGDKVTIIPSEKHSAHVKAFYNKTVVIESVVKTSKDVELFKIKGIKDYATKEDLKLTEKTVKVKSYFENEDSEVCYPLSYHIAKAKEEGLKEIELIEAISNTTDSKYTIWCSLIVSDIYKSECNKSCCTDYLAPEKGRICQHRGKLMDFGDSVKFDVETATTIK